MCGRFTLTSGDDQVSDLFNVLNLPLRSHKFNIAPTQSVLTVVDAKDGGRLAKNMRWGLIPHWAKSAIDFTRTFNARIETVTEKPTFKTAVTDRRCLVVADGFFEWRRTARSASPFRFTVDENSVFAFAGLWDEYESDDGVIVSTTILTTRPNQLVSDYHDRMPVILTNETIDMWLSGEAIETFVEPFDDQRMKVAAVNPIMNDVRVDDERCITANNTQGQLF